MRVKSAEETEREELESLKQEAFDELEDMDIEGLLSHLCDLHDCDHGLTERNCRREILEYMIRKHYSELEGQLGQYLEDRRSRAR